MILLPMKTGGIYRALSLDKETWATENIDIARHIRGGKVLFLVNLVHSQSFVVISAPVEPPVNLQRTLKTPVGLVIRLDLFKYSASTGSLKFVNKAKEQIISKEKAYP
jgi:hypothetical protein